MNLPVQVDQKQLMDVLLNVGAVRPVFIWGAPGIGKSAIVEQFAKDLGLECVSLLGSQLAPEDIIGVPQIVDGRSVFCPPRNIAREEPYCLFLDELNACSHEVQKAFYSLILERRNEKCGTVCPRIICLPHYIDFCIFGTDTRNWYNQLVGFHPLQFIHTEELLYFSLIDLILNKLPAIITPMDNQCPSGLGDPSDFCLAAP